MRIGIGVIVRCWLSVGVIVMFADAGRAEEPTKFTVVVQRSKTKDNLLTGTITVNGEKIGSTFENGALKIPAGTYKGVLRTTSSKNFVQGPGGKLGRSGDFLLEVSGVPKRTDILFHAGNKPEQSEGCIMLGPATRDSKTQEPIAPEALRKLRLKFYDDVDAPKMTPDKTITIKVIDP